MGVMYYIEDYIDFVNVLCMLSKEWDGGYVMCGLIGSGESFVLCDLWGICLVFWYQDDEIVVFVFECLVIQMVFNVLIGEIRELLLGQVFLISKEGKLCMVQINKVWEKKVCLFEWIYFL